MTTFRPFLYKIEHYLLLTLFTVGIVVDILIFAVIRVKMERIRNTDFFYYGRGTSSKGLS